jgi:cell division protein FtsI/penicillin-binding protein 2
MQKRRTAKTQNSVQTIFTRYMFIIALFVIWFGIIGVRLVHLQVSQNAELTGRAQGQRRSESKTRALRGSILDRSNRALAISVKAKSLYADPRKIEDVQGVSTRVAAVLKVKPQEIAEKINEGKARNKGFVWIARKLDEETYDKINEQLKSADAKKTDQPKIEGLHWREEQKRSYPYGALGSHVIGFSDVDDKGLAGVELSQEEMLRGAVSKQWKDRDRLGRVYEESENEEREPPKDVVLTISNSIQYKVETALKNGVEAAKAKSGIAIVLDPRTGEILAMANHPTFDLNKFNEATPELIKNHAVQSNQTPGSVFKLVTYAGALEENLIRPADELDCGNGSIEVATRVFNDKHCVSRISYTDAFSVSSNIGAIRTGQKMGKQKFYDYVRKFGFGQQTGIELPAESKGLLRSPEGWSGDSLASLSIGYEIGVTALQSASAFATIANGGIRVKPHIIKEIRNADGTVFSTVEPEKVPIVSPETAANVRQMLQKVVLSGTGKRAQLNGYSSAGKTGTAWKYDEKLKKINDDKYVSSFIGFATVDNPSVVIAVVLDEPRVAMRDGGQVSAPIFREIAEQILPELDIAPDGFARQDVAQEIIETKEKKEGSADADKKDPVSKISAPKSKPETGGKTSKDGNQKNPVVRPQPVAAANSSKSDVKNKASGKGKT